MKTFASKTFLSIIIPCFNMEKYITCCIQSLKSLNDADDVEFIFINDGSTDATLSIISDFRSTDRRVIVIDGQNNGVSSARNKGLEVSCGEYVLFLDPDDYLDSSAIEIIRQKIEDADLMVPNIVKVFQDHTEYYDHNIPEGFYSVYDFVRTSRILPITPQNIYKNSIIKQNKIRFNNSVRCGEVMEFTVSFLKVAVKVSVISSSFYYYRNDREGQATSIPNFEADITILNTLQTYYQSDSAYSHLSSFILVPFSLSLLFTYSKYLRHGLLDHHTLRTIKEVLDNPLFKFYRNRVITAGNINIKYRLYASYLFIMPSQSGYFSALIIHKAISTAKKVFNRI